MFFLLLCLILTGLLLSGHTPDLYGWAMLMGAAWIAGYLDCRMFARSDQDTDRVIPPDMKDCYENDRQIFKS